MPLSACLVRSSFSIREKGALRGRVSMLGMDDRSYFTYIVASRSLTLYVGMTGDLNKRVFEHKRKLHEGCSAIYNCNRLVWFEEFSEVGDAIAREKQLKSWRREKKITLIKQSNPTWIDLAEAWYTRGQLEGPVQ